MKYNKDEILYFKPSYSLEIKHCRICQIVKYLEKTNQYLVITSDIYCPYHYNKSLIYEDDLGNINDTFVIDEVSLESLYLNLPINDVLKLQFYDLYSEIEQVKKIEKQIKI